jgi:integrase
MREHKRNKPQAVTVGNVTVKIYRRDKAGYEIFEVADYSHGSRKLRSFSNPDEAMAEAKKIARLMAAGETTAAQIRNPQAASFGRAMELLRPTGIALEVAAAHFAQAFKILNGDLIVAAAQDFAKRHDMNRQKKTVREVADEMQDIKTARGASEHSIGDMKWRLAKVAEAFAVNIDSVTTGDVQKWLDGMTGSPRSVLNFRRITGTLFAFAESRGYIAKGENPVTGTEKIKARNNIAVEIYSPAELEKIFAAAHESFRIIIALGAFAGLRSAEIERLDWSEIDLKGGMIEIKAEKTKTASRRLVPVLPNLKSWLEPHAKKSGAIWPHSHPFFHERQREAATGAGLKEWKANGLRHSFISYRLAQVKSAPQVALEAGNSPTMIFQHYRELVKPDAAKKWFNITPDNSTNENKGTK